MSFIWLDERTDQWMLIYFQLYFNFQSLRHQQSPKMVPSQNLRQSPRSPLHSWNVSFIHFFLLPCEIWKDFVKLIFMISCSKVVNVFAYKMFLSLCVKDDNTDVRSLILIWRVFMSITCYYMFFTTRVFCCSLLSSFLDTSFA